MATLKPRGKMTRPMETLYNRGDYVMLKGDLDPSDGLEHRRVCPDVGDTGIIRRIEVSDPHLDGDKSFPLYWVEWASGPFASLTGRAKSALFAVGDDVLIPWPRKPKKLPRVSRAARASSEKWLRSQLATLSK
jgi:hypothetical protein